MTEVRLRKKTRDWLANKTIPNVREIARDLENAGEDVRDLFKGIDDLLAGRPPRVAETRPFGCAIVR